MTIGRVDGKLDNISADSIVGYDRERKVWPVMFSGEMVRSLRARRKSVTRRISPSALGKVYAGDLLYVREAFRVSGSLDAVRPSMLAEELERFYEADQIKNPLAGKLRPGMFMPKKFSRITLEVISVTKEPLHDITEDDAVEEGVLPLLRPKSEIAAAAGIPLSGGDLNVLYMDYNNPESAGLKSPIESFKSLWSTLHKEASKTWEVNPEVDRIEFAVHPMSVESYLESFTDE